MKKYRLLIVVSVWIVYVMLTHDYLNILALFEAVMIILLSLLLYGKLPLNKLIFIFWLSFVFFTILFKILTYF